jgi:hypothetical protein
MLRGFFASLRMTNAEVVLGQPPNRPAFPVGRKVRLAFHWAVPFAKALARLRFNGCGLENFFCFLAGIPQETL